MAEEEAKAAPVEAPATPAPTPKKSALKKAKRSGTPPAATPPPEKKPEAEEGPKAPRRPALEPGVRRLMTERRRQKARRPRFVRQASYRYYRIGRWDNWRRPRGQQSKQRRHYGYRSQIVSIGFGSPRAVRGLGPTGFETVIVRTTRDVAAIDAQFQAALIARTVGTKKRLVLEEAARQRGIHVLNPIVRETGET
ncbi:MAG TPA: 50S ribosomal protein L32e [Thermoplasmata archaeon]|nr:50S ribosomal protein L32e [Thermoplasmata archaeon]